MSAAIRLAGMVVVLAGLTTGGRSEDLATLWAERVKSVVAVEYVTETELERRPTV